ncbi:unnamed protein product [Hydatigera taeniaeformis]|uniref:Uncharacterized protein n=1 Tax=Hydatigena taeniaeformis TaxID=6205 RepID=A0A0R3WZ74_HYDTA|nr:unnamed protein product [Hydatigera taeniaeformis]
MVNTGSVTAIGEKDGPILLAGASQRQRGESSRWNRFEGGSSPLQMVVCQVERRTYLGRLDTRPDRCLNNRMIAWCHVHRSTELVSSKSSKRTIKIQYYHYRGH